MSRRSLRISVAAAASGAILIAASGAAIAAPGAPGQSPGTAGGDRASLTQSPGRGNERGAPAHQFARHQERREDAQH
ncbi:MAG: hypothetical protein ACKOGE_00205, partial [Actinomycetota bacterium]